MATLDGARAFVPNPLPTGLSLPSEVAVLLGNARDAMGSLRAGVAALPRPDLLIRPFRTREAVLSSRIEGTRTSLEEAFIDDAVGSAPDDDADRIEVQNYERALHFGVEEMGAGRPLSLHLIRGLHKRLMRGARGERKQPGELRTNQVWLGPLESRFDISKARFVPPPAFQVEPSLDDLISYVRSEPEDTPLIRVALTHYQFETIHPFSDGNGRIGRLLIVLQMIHEGLITQPWLYISPFLERERDSYMKALYDVSAKGDFLGWIKLFLLAVLNSANDTLERLHRLKDLEAEFRERLAHCQTQKPLALLERLFSNPVITVKQAAELLDTSTHTARANLERLQEADILKEMTIRRRTQGRPPKLYYCVQILRVVD